MKNFQSFCAIFGPEAQESTIVPVAKRNRIAEPDIMGCLIGFSSQLMKLCLDKPAPNFVKLELYFECLSAKIDIWRMKHGYRKR